MPRVSRACERNMVPNLPAPIRPTVTGRPAASRSSRREWRFTNSSAQVSARRTPHSRTREQRLLAHRLGDERLVDALFVVRLAPVRAPHSGGGGRRGGVEGPPPAKK